MESFRSVIGWVCASGMAILTAIAEGASALEPDRLVWILGFAGSLFGVALLPSTKVLQSVVKLFTGWTIAGVASTPVVASHYAPSFVNVHVAALWLGFAGPALFMASTQSSAAITRIINSRQGKA